MYNNNDKIKIYMAVAWLELVLRQLGGAGAITDHGWC